MVKDDYDEVCWQRFLVVSVVVGVLVALWFHVHSVLTVSGDVLGVLVVLRDGLSVFLKE